MTNVAYSLVSKNSAITGTSAGSTAPSFISKAFQTRLESPNDDTKEAIMREILSVVNCYSTMNTGSNEEELAAALLNDQQLLMSIIRYVMPSKSKSVKKLLYQYWEVVPKLDEATASLKQEFILLSANLHADLKNVNHFVRGSCLRLLMKFKEREILEHLVDDVFQLLEDSKKFVRKYSILTLLSIYEVDEVLVPEFKEVIEEFLNKELQGERDGIVLRNGFLALWKVDFAAARDWLLKVINGDLKIENTNGDDNDNEEPASPENVHPLLIEIFTQYIKEDTFDSLTSSEIKLTYLDTLVNKIEHVENREVKLDYIWALVNLTNVLISNSHEFDLVETIDTIVSNLTALFVGESDWNVKLILLSQIKSLISSNNNEQLATLYKQQLAQQIQTILSVIGSNDPYLSEAALKLVLDLVDFKTSSEVVGFLKKELLVSFDIRKSQSVASKESLNQYRTLLITSITKVATDYDKVAVEVSSLLLEGMPVLDTTACLEVIAFLKKIITKAETSGNIDLKMQFIEKLILKMNDIKHARVYRSCLWLLGEYSRDKKLIVSVWNHLRDSLSFKKEESQQKAEANFSEENIPVATGPIILPDGTYSSAPIASDTLDSRNHADGEEEEEVDDMPPLKLFLKKGDYYTMSIISTCIVKLILQAISLSPLSHEAVNGTPVVNGMKQEGILMLIQIVRYKNKLLSTKKIDEDSREKIMKNIEVLLNLNTVEYVEDIKKIYLETTLEAFKKQFRNLLSAKSVVQKNSNGDILPKNDSYKVDAPIGFRLLPGSSNSKLADSSVLKDINNAINGKKDSKSSTLTDSYATATSKLAKIVQLTGFSDAVYAEACILTNQFELTLDMLIVNQTKETLKNLHLQFSTLGDVKILEQPSSINIVAHGFHRFIINCKVNSADTGVIFGNIIYDGAHGDDSKYVILNDVHINIMDYIKKHDLKDDNKFRVMWNEFEWENKINVKTNNFKSCQEYLYKLCDYTNMEILNKNDINVDEDNDENNRFLSCNLFAKSSFGEEVLANVCIEKLPQTGDIVGNVRIRSEGQGLALSLGERIAMVAKNVRKIKLDKI
ncbi:hypothetical protein QEN19_001811 [Hanseniaspora menglaensis]